MQIRITPLGENAPAGKLADAEIHFTEGPLEGLKLMGFSVWESRGRGLNVTFPARSYMVDGERRSFALLRPQSSPGAEQRIRELILAAYTRAESEASRGYDEPAEDVELPPPAPRSRWSPSRAHPSASP